MNYLPLKEILLILYIPCTPCDLFSRHFDILIDWLGPFCLLDRHHDGGYTGEGIAASLNRVHFLVTLFTGHIFFDGIKRECLTQVAARSPFSTFLFVIQDCLGV